MSDCGLCGKVRAHLPEAIRARLEVVEARIRARKEAAARHVVIREGTLKKNLNGPPTTPRPPPPRSQIAK